MGFTPQQVREMTLWEYMACLKGHQMAQGVKWEGDRAAGDFTDDDLARMGIAGFENEG